MQTEPPSAANRHTGTRPEDLPELPAQPSLLIVLSAPSGAGKDAVRDMLISWDLPVHFAVTSTTRPPRPDEIEGLDYHFLSQQQFEEMLSQDAFVEHAMVYGQHKGVPRSEISDYLEQGKDVIIRVDIQGADSLKRLYPESLLIFIAPPSLDEMQRRLVGRDTESSEEQRLRLQMAEAEMSAADSFHHVVVNQTGALETTARQIVQLIADEKRRRHSADSF